VQWLGELSTREYRPSSEQQYNLFRSQNLLASDVTTPLPLDLQAGRVDGVEGSRENSRRNFWYCCTKIVRVQINQPPQPFLEFPGMLRFKGTINWADNVSLTVTARFLLLPMESWDTAAGYNIPARIPAVSVACPANPKYSTAC